MASNLPVLGLIYPASTSACIVLSSSAPAIYDAGTEALPDRVHRIDLEAPNFNLCD